MNFKLLWQAWLIMALLCGTLFTAGIISQNADMTDAAFNPLLALLFFLCGLAWASWRKRRVERQG